MLATETARTTTSRIASIEMTNFIWIPPMYFLIPMVLRTAPMYMNIPKWNGWFILCMFAKIIPGILLRRGGFLAAIIFSTEKRWGQISWPVGPAAHTAHSEHPRSPTACSARCPQFWLDVVHIAGLQRPRANYLI